MSTGICLQCGEMKGGALAVCPHCGHTPSDLHDKAKHILVSDHKLSQAALEKSSAEIKRGDVLHLNPEEIQRWEEMLAAEGKSEDPGKGKLLKLAGIGLLVTAALWMVYLLVA
ncbi:MAG: hypothetical protein ACE10D_08670 [Planctomycetota bacterium]|nr:hypothetical protein [Planctomycetota bacterium]